VVPDAQHDFRARGGRGGWLSIRPPFKLIALLLLALPGAALGQGAVPMGLATVDTTLEAGEADAQRKPEDRGLNKYNHWDFGFTTFRVGYGLAWDFATYSQDDAAKQQVVSERDNGLRDTRLLFRGKFKTKRPITWTMGYMYDAPLDDWFFRQTGFMVGVPEISSHFFIGRTKEGYSQYKHMIGYDLWTFERSPFLDAFIPILGDGIKWIGAAPRQNLAWQVAYFSDFIDEDAKFATYDNQLVARIVWLPGLTNRRVLHLALMGRDVKPDNGQFQARSRPEDWLSPYYVDTGKFSTSHGRTLGWEAYYRNGPWLVGGEYGWQSFDAPVSGDPVFHGGNISVAWLITGETRPYNRVSAYFNAVSPKRTVFEGGPGAWEASLNVSYIDLDDGALRGGRYWRVTPAILWHLMDYMRIQAEYGYGALDRFDLEGKTQFFQLRLFTGL
jgi:phosphate-selective porin OprO/OprP